MSVHRRFFRRRGRAARWLAVASALLLVQFGAFLYSLTDRAGRPITALGGDTPPGWYTGVRTGRYLVMSLKRLSPEEWAGATMSERRYLPGVRRTTLGSIDLLALHMLWPGVPTLAVVAVLATGLIARRRRVRRRWLRRPPRLDQRCRGWRLRPAGERQRGLPGVRVPGRRRRRAA